MLVKKKVHIPVLDVCTSKGWGETLLIHKGGKKETACSGVAEGRSPRATYAKWEFAFSSLQAKFGTFKREVFLTWARKMEHSQARLQ